MVVVVSDAQTTRDHCSRNLCIPRRRAVSSRQKALQKTSRRTRPMLAWAARGAAAAGRGRGHPWPGGRPLPAPGGGRRRLGVVAGAAEALAQVRAAGKGGGSEGGNRLGLRERDAAASRRWPWTSRGLPKPKTSPGRPVFVHSGGQGQGGARGAGSVRGLGPAGLPRQRLTPFHLAVLPKSVTLHAMAVRRRPRPGRRGGWRWRGPRSGSARRCCQWRCGRRGPAACWCRSGRGARAWRPRSRRSGTPTAAARCGRRASTSR